jgi:hypothetical protein
MLLDYIFNILSNISPKFASFIVSQVFHVRKKLGNVI